MKKRMLRGLGAVAPQELRDLGASVRAVVDAMLRIDDATDALADARARIDEVAAGLAEAARSSDILRLGRDGEPTGARPYYVDGVMLPVHHPLASQHEIETVDGITRGGVRFGVVFEGPPGCVHGGHVASFFDQVLGHHTLELGLPAMTASLTLQYRRPTPLFRDLCFEVRIDRVDGRKIHVVGELRAVDDGELYVEAGALFVLPSGAATDPLHRLIRPPIT
jgi:acyl-coenzyme A thioesterase PaaI-like protein